MTEPSPDISLDCAIIGGGPAGLTASLYLLRFHRTIQLFDTAASRARWIPASHNCPGFPGGISGPELLERLRRQIAEHNVQPTDARVSGLEICTGGFILRADERRFRATNVILATGIVDELPSFDWIPDAINVGAVRLCAICDAYEIT